MNKFPEHNTIGRLSAHIDEWCELLMKYGSELMASPRQLHCMILQTTPQNMEDKIVTKPEIKIDHDEIKY